MGLVNITHSNMTQSVIDLQADLLKNSFYLFSDKKAIPVDYYNISTTHSTLDNGLKITYNDQDTDSSLRYNLIHDFYLYGISQMQVSLENGEFGISGSEISGEAIILPDTITPYPGDNFVIKMIKQRYRFSVNSVSMDTFDNGGNYWKIEFHLERLSDKELQPLVIAEYNFVSGNIGTSYSPVLLASKWEVCKELDNVAVMMKRLFRGLYFNDKVQTYTFVYLYRVSPSSMNSQFFYDPYMIEFCIRHKLLSNSGEKYDFLDHKTNLRPDFGIKYSRSIWRIIESRDKKELSGCKKSSAAMFIDDPGTIFASRYEDYFELTYNDPDPVLETFAPALNIIDPQIIGHILENQLFDYDSEFGKYNLLVKYFNYNNEITEQDIIPLERIIETENNMENYFLIPMIIYVVEFYIKNLMAHKPKNHE